MCKPVVLCRSSLLFVLFTLGGCSKSETAQPVIKMVAATPATQAGQPATVVSTDRRKTDVCSLLTSEEIQSVQGEPLKETRASGQSGGKFTVTQCYFALPSAANSISLTVTQKGDGPGARDPKEFWRETFHRGQHSEGATEEEEKKSAPQQIEGLGDEAYWMGTPITNALYVLKGDTFIRLSVGGPGDQAMKLEKAKALAQIVLKRL
jgi:hypothetical protein